MFEQFSQFLFQNLDYIAFTVIFLAFVRLLFISLYWVATSIWSLFTRGSKPDFISFFHALPRETQIRFIHSLIQDQHFFQDMQNQQFHQQEMIERFNQWAMLEGLKSVTPFDHGGYVQGYGFNPSDTMRGFMDTHQHHMDNHHHNNHHSHS